MVYLCIIEPHSTIKKNALLIHTTTAVNLKIMPCEGGLAQKLHTMWFHLHEVLEDIKSSAVTESQVSLLQKEKETFAVNYEKERVFTNDGSRKLVQL